MPCAVCKKMNHANPHHAQTCHPCHKPTAATSMAARTGTGTKRSKQTAVDPAAARAAAAANPAVAYKEQADGLPVIDRSEFPFEAQCVEYSKYLLDGLMDLEAEFKANGRLPAGVSTSREAMQAQHLCPITYGGKAPFCVFSMAVARRGCRVWFGWVPKGSVTFKVPPKASTYHNPDPNVIESTLVVALLHPGCKADPYGPPPPQSQIQLAWCGTMFDLTTTTLGYAVFMDSPKWSTTPGISQKQKQAAPDTWVKVSHQILHTPLEFNAKRQATTLNYVSYLELEFMWELQKAYFFAAAQYRKGGLQTFALAPAPAQAVQSAPFRILAVLRAVSDAKARGVELTEAALAAILDKQNFVDFRRLRVEVDEPEGGSGDEDGEEPLKRRRLDDEEPGGGTVAEEGVDAEPVSEEGAAAGAGDGAGSAAFDAGSGAFETGGMDESGEASEEKPFVRHFASELYAELIRALQEVHNGASPAILRRACELLRAASWVACPAFGELSFATTCMGAKFAAVVADAAAEEASANAKPVDSYPRSIYGVAHVFVRGSDLCFNSRVPAMQKANPTIHSAYLLPNGSPNMDAFMCALQGEAIGLQEGVSVRKGAFEAASEIEKEIVRRMLYETPSIATQAAPGPGGQAQTQATRDLWVPNSTFRAVFTGTTGTKPVPVPPGMTGVPDAVPAKPRVAVSLLRALAGTEGNWKVGLRPYKAGKVWGITSRANKGLITQVPDLDFKTRSAGSEAKTIEMYMHLQSEQQKYLREVAGVGAGDDGDSHAPHAGASPSASAAAPPPPPPFHAASALLPPFAASDGHFDHTDE